MSAMRCPRCGKTHPMCLPVYHRAYRDEKGMWHVYDGVCRCDKEAFDFMVIGAIKRWHEKQGSPVPDYIYKL